MEFKGSVTQKMLNDISNLAIKYNLHFNLSFRKIIQISVVKFLENLL